MFRVSVVLQQIMTELHDAVSEEENVAVIYKDCPKTYERQWPLEFTGPSESLRLIQNGIGRQSFELCNQLQAQHIHVVLPSETHLKPRERFCIPNYHV